MLEEQEEVEDKSDTSRKFNNNEFYVAIMDEDVKRIEDLSKKHGSSYLLTMQDCAHNKVFWKGPAILPLHLAASYRKVKSMQSLLAAGSDPEMRDNLGRTTLHLVVTSWPNILTTSAKQHSKFQTAMIGVQKQAETCLELLCKHGVNINAKTEGESHQTALHLSVRYSALSAVHILASYGANINAVDSSGMTPLHMASGMLHKDIMSCLIKQGADINMRVQHSANTSLHLATVAMATRTTETLKGVSYISELLEHGAKPNTENMAGMTPLQEACCMGNTDLVDLLLRYGASINKLNHAGENCLFLFLNHRSNLKNSLLLVKLISLTYPFTVYNKKGHLPSTLMLPCFHKQRDQLLNLTQQPRRLQDICKKYIYLKHIQGKKEEPKRKLPKRLNDFVFNSWENIYNISFVTDGVLDSGMNST